LLDGIVLVLGCFPVVPTKLPPLASLPSLFSSILAVRFGLRSPIDDEDDDDDEDDWECAKPEQSPQAGMLRCSLAGLVLISASPIVLRRRPRDRSVIEDRSGLRGSEKE
jgi:hypothetical protein